LILTSFFSCNKIDKNRKQIPIDNNIVVNKYNQNRVIGIWKIHGEENSTFQIKKDSIYYTDGGQTCKYEIVNDSFYIYYDGWVDRSKYEITGNKLFFNSELVKDTFERFD